MKEFRCCFKKCRYQANSLLHIFKHMQVKHKLEVGKDVFKTSHNKNKSSEGEKEYAPS